MNTREITNIYAGSTQGSRMYLGDELVWPIGVHPDTGDTPTPDTGDTGYTPVTSITVNVPGVITDSGQAIAVVNPGQADTNIVWSTSDPNTATIDQDGNITVIADGQVTICARDTLSGLQDCETITVVKTPEPGPDTGDTGDTHVLIGIYDVDRTNIITPLTYTNTCVTRVELEDGTEVPMDGSIVPGGTSGESGYRFSTTGLKIVRITITGDTIDSLFQGCSRLKSITIPEGITVLTDGTFFMPSSTPWMPGVEYTASVLDTVVLPSTLISIGTNPEVSSLGASVFRNCVSLTSITIPNAVTYIGKYAFAGCTGLTSITIPNSVTSVGDWMFSGCTALSSVSLSISMSYISNGMFWGCTALQNFTIPSHITRIGNHAFANSGLVSVVIPNNVLELGDNTGDIGEIGGVFAGCTALTSVSIGSGVTIIPPNTFLNCVSLVSITIPNTITIVNYQAFRGCTALQNITLGSSIWGFGSSCFYGCVSLQSIEYPASTTWIGQDNLVNCNNLTEVVVNSITPPGTNDTTPITNWVFGTGSYPIYVPDASVAAYKTSFPVYANQITGISNRS